MSTRSLRAVSFDLPAGATIGHVVDDVGGIEVQDAFDWIPLVSAWATDAEAEALKSRVGVRGVAKTNEVELRIVASIDALLTDEHFQRVEDRSRRQSYRLDCSGATDPAPVKATAPLTASRHMAAVNLSLAPGIDKRFDSADAVNVATEVAAVEIPVVLAAGNFGGDGQVETITGWAEAQWVISVGATADNEGRVVAGNSSRGGEASPSVEPTVVASGLVDAYEGAYTSYAAPKVSDCLGDLLCWSLDVAQAVATVSGETVIGAPRVGIGYVDIDLITASRGIPHGATVAQLGLPDLPLPSLPVGASDPDNVDQILGLLRSENLTWDLDPNPTRLRAMLLETAVPVPNSPRRESGNGFVSADGVAAYLKKFSGLHFARIFANGDLSPRVAERLAAITVAVDGCVETAQRDWRRTRTKWAADLNRYLRPYRFRTDLIGQLTGLLRVYHSASKSPDVGTAEVAKVALSRALRETAAELQDLASFYTAADMSEMAVVLAEVAKGTLRGSNLPDFAGPLIDNLDALFGQEADGGVEIPSEPFRARDASEAAAVCAKWAEPPALRARAVEFDGRQGREILWLCEPAPESV